MNWKALLPGALLLPVVGHWFLYAIVALAPRGVRRRRSYAGCQRSIADAVSIGMPERGILFHEPFPLIPSFSPSGGEGARRAVEAVSDGFMAPIRVQSLEV